jgi:hypothetical protein
VYIIYTMADKKISQFPTFDGTADSEVFFVVGSGEADNPNASNYRYPFDNLTTDITKAGSAWTTGTDLIYTLTGAVGLGTSAPIYQLDVANTGRFRSDLIVSGDMYVSGTTHINKIIDASITGTISGVTGEFTDGFFSNSVGIGTTSPFCNLETKARAGEEEVKIGLTSADGTQNAAIAHVDDGVNERLSFRVGGFTAAVDKLTILNDGNVGIGTPSPDDELHLYGDGPALQVEDNSGPVAKVYAGDTEVQFGSWSDHPVRFNVGASEKMRILSNGNVGIGTTSPTSLLTLSGDNEDLRIVTDVGGTSVTVIGLLQDASNNGSISVNNSVGNNKVKLQSTGVSVTAVSGAFTESLTVSGNSVLTGAAGSVGGKWSDGISAGDIYYNGGNVGIGTDSPSARLDIKGGSTDGMRFSVDGQPYYHVIHSQGDSLYIGADDSDAGGVGADIRFNVTGSEHMRIIANGDVGIGTTTPQGPLHVSNVAANTLSLTREIDILGIANGASSKIEGGALAGVSVSMGAALGFVLEDVDGTDPGVNTKGSLYFETKDGGGSLTEKMRIDSDGNVGIGTTDPISILNLDIGTRNTPFDPATPTASWGDLIVHNRSDALGAAAGIRLVVENSDPDQGNPAGAGIAAVRRDAVNEVADLAFMVDPVLPGPPIEAMRLTNSGDLGVGTDTPSARLHITGGDGTVLAGTGAFTEALTISGVPVSTGNGDEEPAFSSDARLKDDVYTLSDSSDKIKQIRGVGFMWNENSSDGLRGREDVGVIAQEVQQILPSAVEEGSDGYLKVKYHRLIPLLLESVKDLQAENEILKERMDSADL